MSTDLDPKDAAGTVPQASPFVRYSSIVARLLMGLAFFVFGLNGFLNFMPPPKDPMPDSAMQFMQGMMATGYMFKLVAGTQLVVGVLLLLNLFVPLALILIMPVLVNIILFHVLLVPKGFVPGAVLMVLELYLAWVYRQYYIPLFIPKARPGVPKV